LRLIEWEQLDIAAGAAALGCSAGAFKVRLHRARRRLARALDQQTAEPPSSTPGTPVPRGFATRTEIRP
jgi:RNA polymerase sigma-70 factor (ECF subfamily)